MKKLIYSLSITLMLLQSCSSGSDSSPVSSDVLLKKIIHDDGSSSNLEYAGNKLIKSISSDGGVYTIYTYTGDLVTREDNYSSDNTIDEHYEYYYSGNNLIQVKYFIGNKLFKKYDFVINTDNTRTLTRTDYGTNVTSRVFKEYYINEEKVKEEALNSNVSISYTTTFLYDNKNCPYKNITGFRYLNGWFDDNSPFHNIIKLSVSNSSSSTQNYSYQYNSNGYPTDVSFTSRGYTESSQLFY